MGFVWNLEEIGRFPARNHYLNDCRKLLINVLKFRSFLQHSSIFRIEWITVE